MVRSRFWVVGREHAGRRVQVFDHGGRLGVAFPDGTELWLRP